MALHPISLSMLRTPVLEPLRNLVHHIVRQLVYEPLLPVVPAALAPYHVYTHVYTHVYVHIYIHVYTRVYIHACTHVYVHVYVHV